MRKYIQKSEIKETIKLIDGSNTDYVTPNGFIYKQMKNGLFFKKKLYINKHNGYAYVGITMASGYNKSRRVHRLVAKAFIPNENDYDVVGHKNNIKHDNRVDNLYWTTVKENTQKAYDDGLAVNKKGFDDEQSKPVIMYKNNEVYKIFGSLRECARETGIPLQTIIRRCENKVKTYYRKYKEYDFEYMTSSLTTIEKVS